jgi:hypothetical protein
MRTIYEIPGPVFPEDELDFYRTGMAAASAIKGEKVESVEEAIGLLEVDLKVREERCQLIADAEIREGLEQDIIKRTKQIESLKGRVSV